MELRRGEYYRRYGLSRDVMERLALFGDLLLGSRDNVSGIRDPEMLEDRHLLDSLSLLTVPALETARVVADIGSGGGLPAVVLALARPALRVTAIESVGKKCRFIEQACRSLGVENVQVQCVRAEDMGRAQGRGAFDAVVVRAVSALPVLAELGLPLLRVGGSLIAMKGALSSEERLQGERALAILGGGRLEGGRVESFPGAENRWLYVARKDRATPPAYPRRPGVPQKDPLGGESAPREGRRREARG